MTERTASEMYQSACSVAEVQDRVLKRMKIFAQAYVDEKLFDSARVSEMVNFYTDQLCIQIRGGVWAEEITKEKYEYPADWWQAFKERWFPAWLKRRYPPKYTYLVLRLMASYPNFKAPPGMGEVRLRVQNVTPEAIDYVTHAY